MKARQGLEPSLWRARMADALQMPGSANEAGPAQASSVTMDLRRRLLWHGVFLILLALSTGLILPALTNPRLGLSAHAATTIS